MEIGGWVALGYLTQAVGLQTSDASVCAFLCSLTVVSVAAQLMVCSLRVVWLFVYIGDAQSGYLLDCVESLITRVGYIFRVFHVST